MTELEHLPPSEVESYLGAEWGNCTRCPLNETRLGRPIFGKGNIDNPPIVFVGEAPGVQEEKKGEVFVGKTGTTLFDVLWMLDIDKDRHYYTNAVLCRPPDLENPKYNRQPMGGEVSACRERLHKEIYHLNPLLVVALGAVAAKTLGGPSCTLKAYRGEVVNIKVPSEVKGDLTYPMLVTWHPAGVLRRIDSRLPDNTLPPIDNFPKVFFSDDPYEQLVRDLAIAEGITQYVLAAYEGRKRVPEIVEELAVYLN